MQHNLHTVNTVRQDACDLHRQNSTQYYFTQYDGFTLYSEFKEEQCRDTLSY
jgi:hypothetical protein